MEPPVLVAPDSFKGTLRASQVAASVGIGLEAAGLVRSRRQGRYKFHDLDTSPLKAIVERWHIE